MNNFKSILLVGALFLISFQPAQILSCYAQGVDLAESYTVNVPNSQGGYTAIIIKKSGNGYVGLRGEFYSNFPTVFQLQSVYRLGAPNSTVVPNTNVEPQVQTMGIPQNDQQENTIGEKGFVITKDFITIDQCSGQAKGNLILLSRFLGGVNQVEFKKQSEGKYYIIYYGQIKDRLGNSHPVYSDISVGGRETLINALSCFWKGEGSSEAKIVDYIKRLDATETTDLNDFNYEEPAGFDIVPPNSDKLHAKKADNFVGYYGVIFYKNIKDVNGKLFSVQSSTDVVSKADLQNDVDNITKELNSSLNEELKSPLTNFTQEDIQKWESLSNAGDLMESEKSKLIQEYIKKRRTLSENGRGQFGENWSRFLDAGTKIAERAFKEKLLKKINEYDRTPNSQPLVIATSQNGGGFNIITEPGLPGLNSNQNKHYEYCNNYALDDLIKYNSGAYLVEHPNTLYKLEGQVLQTLDKGILFIFAINQIIVGGGGQPSVPAFLYTDHKFQYGERLPAYWVEFAGYVQYDNKRYCAFRMVKTPMGTDI